MDAYSKKGQTPCSHVHVGLLQGGSRGGWVRGPLTSFGHGVNDFVLGLL